MNEYTWRIAMVCLSLTMLIYLTAVAMAGRL